MKTLPFQYNFDLNSTDQIKVPNEQLESLRVRWDRILTTTDDNKHMNFNSSFVRHIRHYEKLSSSP